MSKMTEQTSFSYFARHGHLCASRPMEVIAATLTLAAVIFSYLISVVHQTLLYPENGNLLNLRPHELFQMSQQAYKEMFGGAHLALLTLVRCLALMYCYNQLQMVQQAFSKAVAGYTALFAIISAIVFSSGIINVLRLDIAQVGDFMLFYVLWMDFYKMSQLIETGMKTCSSSELNGRIARTLDHLGPSITFDSIIQILVTSIAFIPGLRRLEFLASLALLAIVMNYIIFMTMFPACLSMIVEVSRQRRAPLALDHANPPSVLAQPRVSTKEEEVGSAGNNNAPSVKIPSSLMGSKPIVVGITYSDSVIDKSHANSTCMISIVKLMIAVSFLLLQSYRCLNSFFDISCVVYGKKTYKKIFSLAIFTTFGSCPIIGENLFESCVLSCCNTPNPVELNAEAGVTEQKMYRDGTNRTDQISEVANTYSLIIGFLLLRMDQVVILGLILILSLKYIFFDSKIEPAIESPSKLSIESQRRIVKRISSKKLGQKSMSMSNLALEVEEELEPPQEFGDRKNSELEAHTISFTVGESESDSDLETSRKTSVVRVFETKEIQTEESFIEQEKQKFNERTTSRSLLECARIYQVEEDGGTKLTDVEVISLVDAKKIPAYQLEKAVQNEERGVTIRRKLLGRSSTTVDNAFDNIPYKNYDYSKITGACCENVVGYIPVPVGVVGPLNLDGKHYQVPMATTEGCLVASTSRGCRALSNGVRSKVVADGMTRGPVVRFPSAMRASEATLWLQEDANFKLLKESFDGSSRFARLEKVSCRIAGRYLFIRFVAKTGDAMGMNMISKGTEVALNTLQSHFHEMEILSLSGNFCTDKKPAAVNWIEGRGKSVVAEAVVPAYIVHNVLKTSTAALVELNIAKNLVGSAVAGSIGGYNAHAANIVAAIFIATGQDTAQCVGSSNCITLMEPWGADGQDLFISCTMPSIEVGTIGGGTVLPPQSACLSMLGLQGPNAEEPGKNARDLARVVCATVLAGELSLMSALAAGHLVRSHLKHNRSSTNVDASLRTVATSPASFSTRNNHSSSLFSKTSNGAELIPKILTSHHNNHFNQENSSLRNISINSSTTTSRCVVPPTIPSLEEAAPVPNVGVLVEAPTSMSVPIPTKSMDLLSVPTECKQF